MKSAPMLALALVFAAPPALAQSAPAPATPATTTPACPALPPELAGWSSGTPLAAATAPADLPKAVLMLGSRADLALAPTSKVSFATAPNKAPAATTNGGMASFTVANAGVYRVALGTSAWINVAKDGTFLKSTAHSHQLGCAGVRKMVDFTLTPGTYVLQIEGGRDAVAGVLIARR